jgi:hypothetical protein
MKQAPVIIASTVCVLGIAAVAILNKKPVMVAASTEAAKRDLKMATEAASQPRTFVEKNATSKDVKVQTQVTRAKMTLAYDSASRKDFKSARTAFVAASKEHKGTDAMSPEFGTLGDQAAYQAIVCLEASGDKAGAKKEYRKFMEERKFSPLVHMCFRRLERINGKNEPEDEARIQSAIDAQEARIRFETSVCGPKCLEKVLPLFGKPAKDYKDIAKLAKTTDSGTTLDGLRDAAQELGLKPIGLELNAKDLHALTKPAIWLQGDHYVVILEINGNKARIFDPRLKSESEIQIPEAKDPDFRATVLAFEVPTTELVSDPTPSKKS